MLYWIKLKMIKKSMNIGFMRIFNVFIHIKNKFRAEIEFPKYKILNRTCLFISLSFLMACSSAGNKNSYQMKKTFIKGTYGFDSVFFAENKIKTIELKDVESRSRILLVPGYQGRVMTSTANGIEGTSFGWINYELIRSGKVNNQFNPYGGEERLWLGPEGGPFSIYFAKGKDQVYANWWFQGKLTLKHLM